MPQRRVSAATTDDIESLRRAVRRLEESERLQHALYAIADLAGSGLEMAQMLARIHAIVGELMPADNFYIALHDAAADTLAFLYFADVATPPPPLGEPIALARLERGLTWYVIRDAKPLRGSLQAIATQVSGPLQARGADARDWLGVPMLDGARVRGALVVQSYEHDGIYGEREQALLAFVASHVLTALQRKRAREDLELEVRARTAELTAEIAERQRGERLQRALYRIAELASGAEGMADFHREVHAVVGTLLNAANYFVALPSDDGRALAVPYKVDERDPVVPHRPIGHGLTEYVLRTGAPLLADDEAIATLVARGEVRVFGTTPCCWLGVPLRCEGRTLGVLAVQSYAAEVIYDERDRDLLVFVSHQIASSLERRAAVQALQQANAELEARVAERTRELRAQIAERERVEARLQHEVVHDALTGLPNRNYLLDRIERLQGVVRRDPARPFAVMFMDVDRFKLINDSIGHHAGDEVLCEVARRLQGRLREPDFVARLGGDEFAVLVEDARDSEAVVRIAQRLLDALGSPMAVAGRELVVTSSIGITVADAHRPDVEELLRNADAAMYRAKANGRHRFELYDEQLHRDAMRVLDLEGEIREALREQRFVPYYQPIVDLAAGRIVGCEVLMRWQHPARGLLAPSEFLRIAEDSGAIEAMDWQIYEQACAQASRTPAFGGVLGLNVSPRHLRDRGFPARLIDLAARHGLQPRRLCVEVTEGALIEDAARAAAQLSTLRDAGMRVALDDFGTGYSALGHVHSLPLSILKIDRSFVAGLGDGDPASQALVRAIAAIGASLGLRVVAEGVETEAQRDAVAALGCHLAQGWLYGRPQPVLPDQS